LKQIQRTSCTSYYPEWYYKVLHFFSRRYEWFYKGEDDKKWISDHDWDWDTKVIDRKEKWIFPCSDWLFERMPMIYIGECSFLKADLFGDKDEYIPMPIQRIYEDIFPKFGGLRITEELISQLRKFFIDYDNGSNYYTIEPWVDIEKELRDNTGSYACLD
jgi:hypothetical protein